MLRSFFLFCISALFLAACDTKQTDTATTRDSTQLQYSVISVLPHNAEAFTQGLVIHNNKIMESTGQKGTSWIAEVNPGSGQHDKKVTLDNQYFGEGITVFNNKIYYLTWQNRLGFIYDANSYKKLGEFKIETKTNEGWGITHDNKNLIVSDGSENLYFLDTASMKITKTVVVKENGKPVKKINELEFINGFVYSNVWETNWILKIDPATGNVVAKLDLSDLANEVSNQYPNANVLNGIAYDKNSGALLVTGKLWPKAYLIKVM
jgi:glutaminyl-peptide cyclotransferase